jgi:3-dehydroquinate dehydratase-2
VVEVHISDVHAREPFRNIDLLADVCARTIIGHGTNGYKEAVEHIIALARR